MRTHVVIVFIAAIFGAACARVDRARTATPRTAKTQMHRAAFDADISETLRQAVEAWAGTPHSSIDSRGLDCSAFVQRVYRDAFALDLPRSSRQQAGVGETVARSALRPGDLVFFTKGRRQGPINHVGFYVGDGTFGHVSSSRGVMLSRLDETYWHDRYHAARRIALGEPGPMPASSATDPPTDRRRTTGW